MFAQNISLPTGNIDEFMAQTRAMELAIPGTRNKAGTKWTADGTIDLKELRIVQKLAKAERPQGYKVI